MQLLQSVLFGPRMSQLRQAAWQVNGTSSSCIQVQLEADSPSVHKQKAPKRGKCLGCVCLPARTPHAGKKVQLAAKQHMPCPLQNAHGDF